MLFCLLYSGQSFTKVEGVLLKQSGNLRECPHPPLRNRVFQCPAAYCAGNRFVLKRLSGIVANVTIIIEMAQYLHAES